MITNNYGQLNLHCPGRMGYKQVIYAKGAEKELTQLIKMNKGSTKRHNVLKAVKKTINDLKRTERKDKTNLFLYHSASYLGADPIVSLHFSHTPLRAAGAFSEKRIQVSEGGVRQGILGFISEKKDGL